ncbi:MAG: T9SS type A sorting domain-containing protein, partial [Gemmatimonadetes bacterium]|nr:T9SS type A sorting domain-containing protein [Gemmatimonadota bacterium]
VAALVVAFLPLEARADLSGLDVSNREIFAYADYRTSEEDTGTDEAIDEILDSAADWISGVVAETPAPWLGTRGIAEMRSEIVASPQSFRVDAYGYALAEASATRNGTEYLYDASSSGYAGLRMYLSFQEPVNYVVTGTVWSSGEEYLDFTDYQAYTWVTVETVNGLEGVEAVGNQLPVLFQGATGLGLNLEAYTTVDATAAYDDVEQTSYYTSASGGFDFQIQLTVSATGAPAVLGRDFTVAASPNPFRGNTRITAARPAEGASAVLSVFDVHGRLVRRWTDVGPDRAIDWDGRTARGEVVPAGVYFVRADDGAQRSVAKLVRLR